MLPGGGGGDPAARRAGQHAGTDQERLADLLDRLRLLGDGHGQRGQADRSPAEAAQQGVEDGQVEPVQAELVDLVHREGSLGDVLVEDAGAADLAEVADPAQQPVGDAGRATGAPGDLGSTVGAQVDRRAGWPSA